MLKKTATIIGLAMVAGTGMAAGVGTSASSDASLVAEFNRLDANHDGVLSRSEASANKKVASLYDSMDTNSTIQQPSKNAGNNGITEAQFMAGMEAASHGGAVGPAVSGGQTYTVMRNGSRRAMDSSESAQKARNGMNQASQRVNGGTMNNTSSQMGRAAQERMNNMRRDHDMSQPTSTSNTMSTSTSTSVQPQSNHNDP